MVAVGSRLGGAAKDPERVWGSCAFVVENVQQDRRNESLRTYEVIGRMTRTVYVTLARQR